MPTVEPQIRRSAIVLGLIAAAFYVGFIVHGRGSHSSP